MISMFPTIVWSDIKNKYPKTDQIWISYRLSCRVTSVEVMLKTSHEIWNIFCERISCIIACRRTITSHVLDSYYESYYNNFFCYWSYY